MHKFKIGFSILTLLISTSIATAAPVTLEQKWVTDGFDRPESLYPSEDGSEIYVSNINGDSRTIDGNGYISRLDLNGNVIEKNWITGLNGPKGFAVENGILYVGDIDALIMIDVKTKEIIKRVPIKDPGFLNDTTVHNGRVFMSDTGKGILYTYTEEDGLSNFLEGEEVKSINGLLPHNGKLLVTRMPTGELLSIDPTDKSISVIGSGIIRGDGIGVLPNAGYIITSFSGEIYQIEDADTTHLLLDTKPDEISQNDAYYINGVLYVANLGNNTVTATSVR
ncbi:MAG: hypothetical protein P8I94_00370 [Emcibacteraceae bacterium]|nr:hypothetical protein [Emcibacteraceae bacterium]